MIANATELARLVAARSIAVSGASPTGQLIGRRAARDLARRELAEVGFWQRIFDWLARLPGNSGQFVPGGWFGLIALAVLGVLAVTLVVTWARPGRPRRRPADAVLSGETMTARDHRAAADRLAAAGDHAAAIVEGVRAIAAELDERGILPPRPGRTADELASEAGRELPALAAGLRSAARLFDDVRYGDKIGTEAGYSLVSQVDRDVRAARPATGPPAQPPVSTGLKVPQ